jgi:coenzyme F420-reducing hydrogenase delta subunit/biotin operon repressor
MCSGRVDLDFILRAFSNGEDGVFIGGCRLDECNYITHGNYDALSNTYICKKIMEFIGLNPDRLRIQFMSGADGNLLAEVTDDFTRQIKTIGPIGKSEGIDPQSLKLKLDAAKRLVPYIRLVERERMRLPVKSKEAYHQFYTSEEFDRLFMELIGSKLAASQIMLLLREKPQSTGHIAERLGLSPSEISKHMNTSSRHGLVRFDESIKCYALA